MPDIRNIVDIWRLGTDNASLNAKVYEAFTKILKPPYTMRLESKGMDFGSIFSIRKSFMTLELTLSL